VYCIGRLTGVRAAGLGGVLALGLISVDGWGQARSSAPRPTVELKATPQPGAPAQPLPVAAPALPGTASAASGSAPRAAQAPGMSPLNPAPEEFPKTEPSATLAPLDALLSRVVALRSRIAALTSALFSSQLRVELGALGDAVRLESLSLTLDGGVIYAAPAQARFEHGELVYEHAVAPGPHILGVEVARHDRARPQFSTWQSSRFVVIVPESKQLWTRLQLEDESSMGEASDQNAAGRYELRIRLDIEVGE
jgi:hypothetical protein